MTDDVIVAFFDKIEVDSAAMPAPTHTINDRALDAFTTAITWAEEICGSATNILTSQLRQQKSFSKLNLIKTYLRNTMTQDHLSFLALLSIENDLVSKIDVIEEFC
ncbi:hypothetical protein J6590_054904 [Homalodisca vitripennis]|nr:hypothetical protein J6590_054904 [Homalodisca vitripennis]